MNLPNKLTMFRIVLIPVLVLFYYLWVITNDRLFNFFLAPIFVVAALTDFFDGYIARKQNLVTVFGKFLDPLADKLIVMAALLLLNGMGKVPVWVTIIILSREFIVTGIRLVAVGEGKVIAASKLGKVKTAITMVGIVFMLLFPYWYLFADIGIYVIYLGTLFTIISGVEYFVKNKDIITSSM